MSVAGAQPLHISTLQIGADAHLDDVSGSLVFTDASNTGGVSLSSLIGAEYTDEKVDDRVNALLIAGTGITKVYDDAGNTLTISIGQSVATSASPTFAGLSIAGDMDISGNINFDNSTSDIGDIEGNYPLHVYASIINAQATGGFVGDGQNITNITLTNVAGLSSALSGKQASDATLTALAGLTITQGSLITGTGADAFAVLAKDTNATRYLSNTGTSNAPAWAQINLANGVTGTLADGNLSANVALINGSNAFTGSCTFGNPTQFNDDVSFSGDIATALTTNRAVITSGSDNTLTASATTATEIGYLSGVSGAIQTQINAKANLTGVDKQPKSYRAIITATGGSTTGLTSDYFVPFDSSPNVQNYNLPSLASAHTAGQHTIVIFATSGGNQITVVPNGSDLINGANSSVSTGSYDNESITLFAGSEGWYTIGASNLSVL